MSKLNELYKPLGKKEIRQELEEKNLTKPLNKLIKKIASMNPVISEALTFEPSGIYSRAKNIIDKHEQERINENLIELLNRLSHTLQEHEDKINQLVESESKKFSTSTKLFFNLSLDSTSYEKIQYYHGLWLEILYDDRILVEEIEFMYNQVMLMTLDQIKLLLHVTKSLKDELIENEFVYRDVDGVMISEYATINNMRLGYVQHLATDLYSKGFLTKVGIIKSEADLYAPTKFAIEYLNFLEGNTTFSNSGYQKINLRLDHKS